MNLNKRILYDILLYFKHNIAKYLKNYLTVNGERQNNLQYNSIMCLLSIKLI